MSSLHSLVQSKILCCVFGFRTSRSPSESPDRMPTLDSNPLVRAGSIKAWKEEQERIRQEQDLAEQLAEEKKAKSEAKKVFHLYLAIQ